MEPEISPQAQDWKFLVPKATGIIIPTDKWDLVTSPLCSGSFVVMFAVWFCVYRTWELVSQREGRVSFLRNSPLIPWHRNHDIDDLAHIHLSVVLY